MRLSRLFPVFAAPLLLGGCNVLAIGALMANDPSGAALPTHNSPALTAIVGRVFALTPPEGTRLATSPVEVANATPGAAAALTRANTVRLMGQARVSSRISDSVNVRGGYVTGSLVKISDAMTGKTMGTTVSYFDGSFEATITFPEAQRVVVVSTDLLETAAVGDVQAQARESMKGLAITAAAPRTLLAAPTVLRASDGEHFVSVTPGTTALTGFLQNVVRLMAKEPAVAPEVGDDFSLKVGPGLSALVVAMAEKDRDAFATIAEASPELRDAGTVRDLRKGLRTFIDRLAESKQ